MCGCGAKKSGGQETKNQNRTTSHRMMITLKEKGQNLKKAAQVQLLNGLDFFSFEAGRS